MTVCGLVLYLSSSLPLSVRPPSAPAFAPSLPLALTQGETPQVLWVRSDHEIENDPDATQQFSQKALTSSPEDLQDRHSAPWALMQGETPQVLWVRSDNEIESDADATQPAKQEDASAFAWPSKASARVRSPANTSPARSLANTSPATTSPSRSASPGYRGDARHGLFRTEGPRRGEIPVRSLRVPSMWATIRGRLIPRRPSS
eukprot:s3769_g4.t1